MSLPLASIPTLDTPPVAAPSSIILPSNPSDVSSETFESIIHDYFPQKARHIQPEPFSNPGIIYPSSIRKVVPHLLSLLRILSKESLASAMLLLKAAERWLHQQSEAPNETYAVDQLIVNNMSSFISTNLASSDDLSKDAKYALLRACTGSNALTTQEGNGTRVRLSVSNNCMSNTLLNHTPPFSLPSRSNELSSLQRLQQESTCQFWHRDEASRIDSDSNRAVVVTRNDSTETHVGIVWDASTWTDKCAIFSASETIKSFLLLHPIFKIPSKTSFCEHTCPCP